MRCDAAWQCGHVVKMNSSATTLPRYWLRSSWPFPGTVNATSGALRMAGASVLAAKVETENTNTPMRERNACFKTLFSKIQCNERPSKSLETSTTCSDRGRAGEAVTNICDTSQNFFPSNSERLADCLLPSVAKSL